MDHPGNDSKQLVRKIQSTPTSWAKLSPEQISQQLAALSPQDRALLINANPEIVGNTDGVPWDMRFAANEINIANALAAERSKPNPDQGRIRTLEDMLAPADNPTTNARPKTKGGQPDSSTNDFIQRTFLRFDPQAQGRAIEVVGTVDDNTRNIGVFVPVTGTTLSSLNGYRERIGTSMLNSPQTATIMWQDADFPDDVIKDAPFSNYANTAAPDLVSFSQELQRQLDGNPQATTTYVAHSYGASILGTANNIGDFYSDREVYVAPSGSGTGVTSAQDWHNLNPDVQRYTLTAPGDNIAVPQQAGESLMEPFDNDHFVLSANPAHIEGVTRLDTGYYLDGTLVAGPDAHSGVFTARSTSLNNIIGVIKGGDVSLYNPRTIEFDSGDGIFSQFELSPESENNLLSGTLNLGRSLLSGNELSDPHNYHVVEEAPEHKVPVK